MASVSVTLFGSFDALEEDGQAIEGLDGLKVQELLSYLLLFRKPHLRETIAGVLWGDVPSARSRKYLRQALWRLHQVFGSGSGSDHVAVLLVDSDVIQANLGSDLWLDVAMFERGCLLAQGISGENLSDGVAALIEETVPLYRGDLLEGWYQDWCLRERERLHSLFMTSLFKLTGYCETNHRYEAGIRHGEQILQHDPAHELTHQRLMRLYYLAGDRTQALRQYDRCARALEEELDVRPAHYTQELHQQIRSDRLGSFTPATRGLQERDRPALSDLESQIRQLQFTLADVQERLHHI